MTGLTPCLFWVLLFWESFNYVGFNVVPPDWANGHFHVVCGQLFTSLCIKTHQLSLQGAYLNQIFSHRGLAKEMWAWPAILT